MQKRLDQLKNQTKGQYWAERILGELEYLVQLTGENDAVSASILRLKSQAEGDGAITRQAALAEEQALAGFGAQAKSLTLHCAAHAHIDMNWMWALPETVNVVIDTFQTMLDMMDKYPAFVFSQSQASTYQIIEKYAPSLLEPIKERVRQGRWEVTATHWVEPDKNMISTESMARHLLYTKKYLSNLLGIAPETLRLDFEPDTFGHPLGIPEVFSHAGVRYMYHCRGNDEEEIYRWRSPSGSEILVYRDPNWYNHSIEYGMTAFLPAFCRRNHVSSALKVYGVGDHGGGPTRRDIERVLDMQTWPLMPSVRFGRMDEFFQGIEAASAAFPVVERELNFVFTGCYTTQSRIKRANRIGEDHLYDAEALHSMARLAGCEPKPSGDFAKAWQNVLFNHFHDILPGSGVRDTREYALGLFQETDSILTGGMNRAMQAIAGDVDTSALGLPTADAGSAAEGAGVGHGSVKGATMEYSGFTPYCNVSDVSRGGGDIRAFVLFNTTQYARRERVQLTLWDWEHPLLETSVYSENLEELPFDVLGSGQLYWAHKYDTLAFSADVPALGYATVYVALAKSPRVAQKDKKRMSQKRVQYFDDLNPVLESQSVRAEFDRRSLKLLSLQDKHNGRELLSAPACFRLVDEENVGFFSAWMVGRYGGLSDIQDENFVSLTEEYTDGEFGRLSYQIKFRQSKLIVRVTLDGDMLRFCAELDWREESGEAMPVPQLQFVVPYAYHADCIRYDAAVEAIDRQEADHDVPALAYAAPVQNGGGLMLTSDCKYGYRAVNGSLSVTLIRSSFSPDKTPEFGVHAMELGLAAVPDFEDATLHSRAMRFSHPIYVRSAPVHKGKLPPSGTLLNVSGGARITALKPAEEGEGLLVRLAAGAHAGAVALAPAVEADITDIHETPVSPLPVANATATAEVKAHSLQNIRILPGRAAK